MTPAPITRPRTRRSGSSTSSRSERGRSSSPGGRRARPARARSLDRFLGARSRARVGRSRRCSDDRASAAGVRPERRRGRRGPCRPARRAQDPAASGVRDQGRRLRRRATLATGGPRSPSCRCSAGSTISPSIVESREVDRVIVAFSGEADDRTMSLVRSLRDEDVIVDLVPQALRARRAAGRHPPDRGSTAAHRPTGTTAAILAHRRSALVDLVGAAALLAADRADLRDRRDPDQAGVTRAGLLPPDEARHEQAAVHRVEVPDDEGRHRRRRASRVHPAAR